MAPIGSNPELPLVIEVIGFADLVGEEAASPLSVAAEADSRLEGGIDSTGEAPLEPVDIGDILADIMPGGWHELPLGRRDSRPS